MNIWELLEQAAPEGCEGVQDLYSWSLNYDPGKGPFTLYLDLIGYSDDVYGEPMYNLKQASLGWIEIDKLATALTAYANDPQTVRPYVDQLMQAETEA